LNQIPIALHISNSKLFDRSTCEYYLMVIALLVKMPTILLWLVHDQHQIAKIKPKITTKK